MLGWFHGTLGDLRPRPCTMSPKDCPTVSTQHPFDVVTLGETLISFSAAEPGRIDGVAAFRKRLGGAETNTAIGLARLGASVAWISRLGDDPFGDEIVRTLRGEGVDVSAVVRDRGAPTGLMVKEFRARGETHVHYYRDNSAASTLSAADVDDALVANARRVHLTGITLALGPGPRGAVERLLACAADHDVPVSFDPNLRLKLTDARAAVETWQTVFPYVSDLLLSEDEARLCTTAGSTEGMLDELAGMGFSAVVIKRGAEGAVGAAGAARCAVAASGGAAIDSVGAGDAFNAGFLFGRLRGATFAESVELGVWVAGHVVGGYGDWEDLPTLRDHEAVHSDLHHAQVPR